MINATPNTSSPLQPGTNQPAPPTMAQPMNPTMPPATPDVPKAEFKKPTGGPRKIFGVDVRAILTVLGLTVFFIIAMLGVIIALRQRQVEGPVAPTAPESQPAASGPGSAPFCTLSFTVTEPGTSPSPSPSVVPSPSPEISPSPSPEVSPSPSPSVSPSPSPSASPSPSPTYSCDAECTSDAQCQTVNADYVCSSDDGNRCRVDSNRGSASCEPAPNTYACNSSCTTDAQCQTANSSYLCYNGNCRLSSNQTASNCQPPTIVQPSPTIGCNQTCVTNADCTNENHICYTTADGSNRCRLDNYVNSETCTPPGTVTTTTPVASGQPQLPEQLPETGPREWGQVIMAGIGIILAGAALLLLL